MLKKRDDAVKDFDRKINKLEGEYREVKSENRRIKDYIYALSVAFVALVVAAVLILKFTGFISIEFSSGSLTNVVSEGNFSHVTIGTDAPYSQSGYGLISYFSFDGDDTNADYQTGYGAAVDYSSNNYNGDYTGDAAVTNSGCLYGKCIAFNEAGGFVSVNHNSAFNMVSANTLSFWMKSSDTGDRPVIISKVDTGIQPSNGWYVKTDGTQLKYGGYDNNEYGVSFVPDGNWHHVALTSDGSNLKFYIDNSLAGTQAYSAAAPSGNTAPIRFGNNPAFPGGNWIGQLDEVMFFNHALTAQQVADIYNNASNRFASTQGNHSLTGINLGTNNTANITLGSYVVPSGTSIQAMISSDSADGAITSFTDGVITNYSLPSGDLSSATLKIIYNTDANKFFSPIAKSNVTIDAWISAVADSTLPLVSLVYPTNTTYTSVVTALNYTASDETALDSCWYSLDSGANNSSRQACGTNWTGLTASQGSNRWTVYVNDSSNNVNSSSVTFFVDSVVPSVVFADSTSSGSITGSIINVSLVSSDANSHYSLVDLDNGLVGWWRAEDSVSDSSSNSNTGTLNGGATYSSGMFGRTFSLDGAGDYVSTSNLINLSSFSASFWVKPSSLNNCSVILSNGFNDSIGYYAGWQIREGCSISSRITFCIGSESSLCAGTASPGMVQVGAWSHVAVVYNSTTALVYLNGVLNYSGTKSNQYITNNVLPMVIGSNVNGDNGFNGSIDEVMVFNRTLGASEVASLYDSSANQYSYNLTGLSAGVHNFTGYAVDSLGNLNNTSERSITLIAVDSTAPAIAFAYGIPNNGDVGDSTIFVNVSIVETNLANVTYYLYNSSGLYNSTTFDSAITSLTFNTPAGNYSYQVNATDSYNNKNGTTLRTITILPSCEAGACTEGSTCTVSDDCYLNNGVCSGGICQFINMSISAAVYTLYDASGNGNVLTINLTQNVSSPLLFTSGGKMIFNGRNGTDILAGSVGGNAGEVNITTTALLNTSSAFFYGIGGHSTFLAADGGAGGNLGLFFHGLIRKFSDLGNWDGEKNPLPDNTPVISGGASDTGSPGSNGLITYTRSLSCPSLDPDIDVDGVVYNADRLLTERAYANRTGDSTYVSSQDINCDNTINVIELSREGFQWATRGTA